MIHIDGFDPEILNLIPYFALSYSEKFLQELDAPNADEISKNLKQLLTDRDFSVHFTQSDSPVWLSEFYGWLSQTAFVSLELRNEIGEELDTYIRFSSLYREDLLRSNVESRGVSWETCRQVVLKVVNAYFDFSPTWKIASDSLILKSKESYVLSFFDIQLTHRLLSAHLIDEDGYYFDVFDLLYVEQKPMNFFLAMSKSLGLKQWKIFRIACGYTLNTGEDLNELNKIN